MFQQQEPSSSTSVANSQQDVHSSTSNNNNNNSNNGGVVSNHSKKNNRRKRKNKSSTSSASASTSTNNNSQQIDDQNNENTSDSSSSVVSSSLLPLSTRNIDHHNNHNNNNNSDQQQQHSKVLPSSSNGNKKNNSKSTSNNNTQSTTTTTSSASNNQQQHNNQKQASKKNKQHQSSRSSSVSSSTSTKSNNSNNQNTSSVVVGGTNSKAGSLRGSGGQQQNIVDRKKKGTLSVNKEIHVNNQESKSPTHRQLLKKIKSKVSTVNFSQVVKYKCLDSESQAEKELTMKKTSIINMAEIASLMNRRAQYLMKYIGFKTDKTCFFDVNDEIGYILHEHVSEVKKELTENNGKYEEKDVKVKTLTGGTISMNEENQMSKLVDQILQSYISNYMVCPSCKSIKTTNPIVVDHDQQQKILKDFKDDNNVDELTEYQEEQLIERLDDFTFFTIQCRDCDHKERIDNGNSSDEFIKQILQSRQRNLTKMFKQSSNYQSEENYNEQESYPQPTYGYPYQPEPPVYYYPYYVEVIPGEHNAYAPYYPPPMYGYYPSFYPTQPVFSPHYDIAASQENNDIIERDPVVEQNYKSAGVIAYSIHQGKIYFLLGKENRGGKGEVNPNISFEKGMSPYKIAKQMFTWSEFGGKREKTDTNSAETAAREFYEETKAAFGNIYDKLAVSEGYYFENGKYNLFITELEYLTSEEIQERSTIDSSVPFTEKVDLSWIDAEELMKRINDRTKQYYHAESGLMKIPVNGNENEFLHPFALSLFRFASKTLTKLITPIKN